MALHPRLALNNISSVTWPLERDLEFYAGLGVQAISVFYDKLHAVGDDKAIELVRASGMRTVNVFTQGVTLDQPDRWADDQARLRATIDAAQALGAPCAAITSGPSGPMSWDEAVDALGRALEPLLEPARAAGVTIAVEQTLPVRLEVGFIHSLRESIEVARRFGIGAVLEINYCAKERGIEDTIRSSVDTIATIQLSDLVPPSTVVPDRAVPGDGVLPIAHIVGTAVAAGYNGPFELELLGPRIEAEGYESVLRRSVAALDQILTAAGA